jgi:hypothetical protein
MKLSPSRLSLPRILAVVLSGAFLAPAVRATWSIVAVNTRTGEVCIASATCLSDLNLQSLTPVLRVGVGGACAQSVGDSTGFNRMRIWDGLISGLSPEEILAVLSTNDSLFQRRQYGIVNMLDEPVSFSGTMDGQAYYSIARVCDDLRYAIQGNVLTGVQVITNSENAFLATEGDLGQKVMAAMEAARVYGGDGRCSCSEVFPTSCGCPPAAFDYSAFTAFWILARMGDVDDDACPDLGCAGGQYFGNLNVISGFGGPEPVLLLEDQYVAWRAARAGLADQIRSTVTPSAERLDAHPSSHLTVEVELRDLEGAPVLDPSTTLSVDRAYDGPEVAKIGHISSPSPGRFRFAVHATRNPGIGRWRLTAHQGTQDVLLWPELVIPVDPLP